MHMSKRRAAIYIFPVLLTFTVISVSPPVREVSIILAKDFQKEFRQQWEPATFTCGYFEPTRPFELMDLAIPLPPAPQKITSRRKAQSNKALQLTAR